MWNVMGWVGTCLHLAVPAAVKEAISKRGAIQAGMGGNSFCCPGFQMLLNVCQRPYFLTWEGGITELDYPA